MTNNEETVIKFYPNPSGEFWQFPCEEALKILERAKIKLLTIKNKGTIMQRLVPIDPVQVNEQAEKTLADIINHPERETIEGKLVRFGDVLDIYAPKLGGARYASNGEFIGFLEP